jgi:hypothetical protein
MIRAGAEKPASDRAFKAGDCSFHEFIIIALREIRLVMRATTFITLQGSDSYNASKLHHAVKLPDLMRAIISPITLIVHAYALPAFQELLQFNVGLTQLVVIPRDRHVAGHPITKFLRKLERILRLGKRKHIPTAEFQGGAAGEEAAQRAERAYSLGLWSARVRVVDPYSIFGAAFL